MKCGSMKQNNIPFKEKQRHYDYQYNQPDRAEKIALKHENQKLKRLKEQALKGGAE